MEFVQRVLRNLRGATDLYCQSFQLCFAKNSQYSTSLGQISSLFIHLICLFTFFSLTIDLLQLNDPNIVSKTLSNLNPERINLNPENFFIGFGVVDNDGLPIVNYPNQTVFGVRMAFTILTTIVDKNGRPQSMQNFTDIQMVPCLSTQVNDDVLDQFKEKLSVMYCPNITDWNLKTDKTFLQGSVVSQQVTYIFLRIYPCHGDYKRDYNVTSCAPEDYVKTQMQGGYVVSAVYDNLLDQSQPGNPYIKTLKIQTSPFNNNSSKTYQYLLRHSYFYSEINFFHYFPRVDEYHVLTQSGISSQVTSDPYAIYELTFIIDDRQEQYFRSYSSFFDVLGNIGGIQSFLVLIVGMIINPIIQQSQQIDVINEVFDVDTDDNNEKDLKKGQLEVPFYGVLLSLCYGQTHTLIDKGSDEIKKYLDVSTIIRKLNQIERLKYLLLDDNQLKMFDIVTDPKLSINGNSNKVHQDPEINVDEADKSQNLEDYGQAFYRMTKSNNLIDQKMLTLVKPSMVRTFEKLTVTERELNFVSKFAKSGNVVPFRSIDSIIEDK